MGTNYYCANSNCFPGVMQSVAAGKERCGSFLGGPVLCSEGKQKERRLGAWIGWGADLDWVSGRRKSHLNWEQGNTVIRWSVREDWPEPKPALSLFTWCLSPFGTLTFPPDGTWVAVVYQAWSMLLSTLVRWMAPRQHFPSLLVEDLFTHCRDPAPS